MSAPVTHLVVGPGEHGVTRFGIELTESLHDNDFHTLSRRRPPDRGGVHVQFTDRLFGSSPEEAAAAVCTLAQDVRARGGRITMTLHDLPQPSDGGNHDRRRAAYTEVVALADGVVVSSEHERALLDEAGVQARRVAVIPLPVDVDACDARPHPTDPPTVGIFGFLYPGKGHAEVIAALTETAADVEILALGAPSAGHADLVDELTREGARTGRRFRVTGHLPDAEVPGALRGVTVPVAPHRHVSASGSLNSWLAAGRRPLVPANRYSREMQQRNPDAVLLYPDTPEGLREALLRALADPESTWLPPGAVCHPSRAAAARRYAEVLARWHA